ncbi:MAG: GAF domain-containing protein [Bacteroidota bacterium]|nr:GAF domain-containing protein [Bacteroidota bacterium]
MNQRKIYISAGIIIASVYITASLFFLFGNDISVFSNNIISTSLIIVSFFFLTVTYFRVVTRKFKKPVKAESPDITENEIKEETKTKETLKTTEKELNQKAEKLGDKLFGKIPTRGATDTAHLILTRFAEELNIVQGIFFLKQENSDRFSSIANYAYYAVEPPKDFTYGEGISGQAAKEKRMLNITNVPPEYITVLSGLGSSSPNNLLILPIIKNDKTIAVLEVASFSKFPEYMEKAYKNYQAKLGETLATEI